MHLIDRIEINYFRSVYSVSIKDLKDLNVFLGPNDAGKSNVLRALNLFFNNESGYNEDIQFLQDVTHLRQDEARDAKGRLTIWIKIHFNNVEKWKTLPNKFFIKKTWNRYSDDPEIFSDVENKQSLTKFQNKINFHYVPAVKERNIFSDYLNLLYETLSGRENIEFSGPASQLSAAVNASITDLTDTIKVALQVKSNIQIPNDLESIFERLEFYTDQDSFSVPLTRRGDGLQVRHIPHILQYISQNNKGLNIWGYEEPENSLEMSNAFALAGEFKNEFAKQNQIFITSHSPAFYSLDGNQIKHFLVKKAPITSAGKESWITAVEDLESTKVADIEMGVAQLVASRSEEAYNEIRRLQKKNDELAEIGQPVVLTEGKTDALILKNAWLKLYPEVTLPFKITSCDLGGMNDLNEAAGADELNEILESTTRHQVPVRLGVFDHDKKGSSCFEGLKKHKTFMKNADVKINDNQKSAALRLPKSNWGSPHDRFINESFCIEMMFPYYVIPNEHIDFEYMMGDKKLSVEKGKKWLENFNNSPDLFDDVPFKIVPKFKHKTQLSDKLSNLTAQDFEGFKPLFDMIKSVVGALK